MTNCRGGGSGGGGSGSMPLGRIQAAARRSDDLQHSQHLVAHFCEGFFKKTP